MAKPKSASAYWIITELNSAWNIAVNPEVIVMDKVEQKGDVEKSLNKNVYLNYKLWKSFN